jgi:hypothetical protein
MTTNNDVTRDDLARALRDVLPWASIGYGHWNGADRAQGEQAINNAKALLGAIEEAENRVRSAPSDIGINDAWLGGITDSLRVDAGFSSPHALVRYYAAGVRNMHKRGWKPDEAAVAITEAETLTPDERIERYVSERFPSAVAASAAETLRRMYLHGKGGNAWDRAALSQIFAAEAL